MFTVAAVLAVFALGFGAGRVKHPANLKLSAVKAEIAKIEADGTEFAASVVARIKGLL
jgi:hypothetical protein